MRANKEANDQSKVDGYGERLVPMTTYRVEPDTFEDIAANLGMPITHPSDSPDGDHAIFHNHGGSDVLPQSSAASMRSARSRYRFFGRRRQDVPMSADDTASLATAGGMSSSRSPERSMYAMSTLSGRSRLWRGKPWDSFRSSFLGRRRDRASGHLDSLPTHTETERSRAAALEQSKERFESAEEYYRHLRMRSISRPLGFQHLEHMTDATLHRLAPVNETEHAVRAGDGERQQPQQADGETVQQDPKRHHREASITSTPLILARPISPMFEGFDDIPQHLVRPGQARFDEDSATTGEDSVFVADQSASTAAQESATLQIKPSSLIPPSEQPCQDGASSPVISIMTSRSADESDLTDLIERYKHFPDNHDIASFDAIEEEVIDAGAQTTPSLASTTSETFAHSTRSINNNPSTVSTRSSRSSTYIGQNSAVSTNFGDSQPSVVSDATWEDDVDFCYQQQAESTCDFDWNFGVPPDTAQDEDTTLASAGPFPPLTSLLSPREDGFAASYSTTNASSPKSMPMQKSFGHVRALSIGHRGFSAARSNSKPNAPRSLQPPPLHFTWELMQPSGPLSPIYSIGGDQEGVNRDKALPPTPRTDKSNESLGIQECGSDASGRLPATQMPQRPATAEPSIRASAESFSRVAKPERRSRRTSSIWSIASITNVPDLLSSSNRHSGRSSLSKASISLPLESNAKLSEEDRKSTASTTDSSIVPREMQTLPMRNVFTIRRPDTPEVRALLQAAGRASQRGRPMSPTAATYHGYRPMSPLVAREGGGASSLCWM